MPSPESAEGGVYCDDGCHQIKPKYGVPKARLRKSAPQGTRQEKAIHFK
jgi:hypothetical protein